MKLKTILISLVSILGTFLLIYGIIYLNQYSPKYKWYEIYSTKSEEPYGIKTIFSLLNKTTDPDKFHVIDRPLSYALDSTSSNALYMFIGGNYYFDSVGLEKLIRFVKRGNTVFICSNISPSQISGGLYKPIELLNDHKFITDSVIQLHFNHEEINDTFQFHFQYLKKKSTYYWNYFESNASTSYSNYQYTIHSLINDTHINMFSVKYGLGKFIFHANPILFTNYYLIEESGYTYINKVLTLAGDYDAFYWDEFSRLPHITGFYTGESPFRFILSRRSLRYALYFTLFLIFMYLLFHSKRIQAVIPIYETKKNTSIEFVKAVGTLYSKKSTHVNLGNDIMTLFLSYIRSRYHVNTQLEKEILIKKIAIKSELPEKQIKQIFDIHLSVKYDPKVEKRKVIQLHQSIENFYKNCK